MEQKALADRQRIQVSIFNDEFARLGLAGSSTLVEAQTAVREKLGLPARQKSGSIKTTIKHALKDADDEKMKKVLEILNS